MIKKLIADLFLLNELKNNSNKKYFKNYGQANMDLIS